MAETKFDKRLFYGNSRRKVKEVDLSLSNVEQVDQLEWHCRVIVTGDNHRDSIMKGCSAFDSLVFGLSFLRQALREILESSPKTKFYEDLEGELFEVTIDDVFGTVDCVPENVEDIRHWAKKKGYKPDC